MAKRTTMLPRGKQRDRSRDEQDMLLRSAESLGRVIAELQRQLEDVGMPMKANAMKRRKKR